MVLHEFVVGSCLIFGKCYAFKMIPHHILCAAERANSLACALGSLPETEGLADGLPDDDMTFGARL